MFMSKDEVQQFREEFRRTGIPKSYSPSIHVIFNFGSTALLFLYLLLHVEQFEAWHIFVLIPAFLLANFGEYLIHRFPLHRPYPIIHKATFSIHQEAHHHFFTNEYIVYDEPKDLLIIFFHPILVVILMLVVVPALYLLLPLLFSQDLSYLILAGTCLYFITYEVVHYICHLPEDHVLIKIRLLRFLRMHHLIHHNLKLMTTTNFNIVFPVWDWILGTRMSEDEYRATETD